MLRSVSQWARILQTTFPHSLDGWLSCLFDQWEVLHCKAGLEMEKGDKEGRSLLFHFCFWCCLWQKWVSMYCTRYQIPSVDGAAVELVAVTGDGQRSWAARLSAGQTGVGS